MQRKATQHIQIKGFKVYAGAAKIKQAVRFKKKVKEKKKDQR